MTTDLIQKRLLTQKGLGANTSILHRFPLRRETTLNCDSKNSSFTAFWKKICVVSLVFRRKENDSDDDGDDDDDQIVVNMTFCRDRKRKKYIADIVLQKIDTTPPTSTHVYLEQETIYRFLSSLLFSFV